MQRKRGRNVGAITFHKKINVYLQQSNVYTYIGLSSRIFLRVFFEKDGIVKDKADGMHLNLNGLRELNKAMSTKIIGE